MSAQTQSCEGTDTKAREGRPRPPPSHNRNHTREQPFIQELFCFRPVTPCIGAFPEKWSARSVDSTRGSASMPISHFSTPCPRRTHRVRMTTVCCLQSHRRGCHQVSLPGFTPQTVATNKDPLRRPQCLCYTLQEADLILREASSDPRHRPGKCRTSVRRCERRLHP